MAGWTFYRHMPVYLRSGKRLGYAVEIGHAVDCLHVQQGRFLVKDWYIPIEAVGNVDAGGVRLDVEVSDLRHRRLHVPPEGYLLAQGATPGYEYAVAADHRGSARLNMESPTSEPE